MKKVLITGAKSYVGTSFENYVKNHSSEIEIDTIDLEDKSWENEDFSPYDVVFHVAGIAHSDIGKATESVKAKYYEINTDLAIKVAKKAKEEGVSQFIFMSSSIVYGDSSPIGRNKIIDRETVPEPANFYGDSKYQAEKGLIKLSDSEFRVVILRCPMIYGKGSKGNFPQLEKIANKTIVFPKVNNSRTMLYIGNLVEFVRLMIINEEEGVFWPCNKELSNTSELVKMIAKNNNRKMILIPGFVWLLRILSHFTGYVNKAFGNMEYESHLGDYKEEYRAYNLDTSIRETVK